MVFKSQLFLIYSFSYVLLNPHKNCHVGELTKKFEKIWMWDDVVYVNHVFK